MSNTSYRPPCKKTKRAETYALSKKEGQTTYRYGNSSEPKLNRIVPYLIVIVKILQQQKRTSNARPYGSFNIYEIVSFVRRLVATSIARHKTTIPKPQPAVRRISLCDFSRKISHSRKGIYHARSVYHLKKELKKQFLF